jgi:lipopolysaccharide export system permease protein
MFRIIDRYLLFQFVQVLLICVFSLIGLYIVIDVFGHLDHFIDYSRENGNLLGILAQFYAYRSLAFFDRTSGILALIAAMFTVTWIQRHHEMTALMAAGIPRIRVLRWMLIGALSVTVFAAINREVVIPGVRAKMAVDSRNLGGERETELQPRFDSQTEVLLAGDKVIPKDKIILRPSFILPAHFAMYGKQITARKAGYKVANDRRPAGYKIWGVTSPKALLDAPSLTLSDGTPVVITPQDADWLKPNELYLVSGVTFEFLTAGTTWRDFASTRELIQQLNSPSTDLGADVRVAVHARLLQPFMDTTLLFLGLPLVVSRGNRNPFLAIGICLGVVTTFMLVALGCQSLGISGWLEPALAAWLPLIIFAPIAVAMSQSLRE